jgi:hypothetical protein
LELPDTLHFYARWGYRIVGEESHPGYTTPTFAWLRKDLTDENNGTSTM